MQTGALVNGLPKKTSDWELISMPLVLPTQVYFQAGAVLAQAERLKILGRKALIITGRSSAKNNGSLRDCQAALDQQGIHHLLLDRVDPNPSFQKVMELASAGLDASADFVIGLGGGSAIDAAKAVAVLVPNPEMTWDGLYQPPYAQAPLPIVAVPTTAGSGSEVTPYSVLTDNLQKTKRPFKDASVFPRLALLDPKYTLELPPAITNNTAVDALSHLLEGYLSQRAEPATDALVEKGLAFWQECKSGLAQNQMTPGLREKMLQASLHGGMVIAKTGTAAVHTLGYSLTYFRRIPHGRANGYLLSAHLRRCGQDHPRVRALMERLQFRTVAEFSAWLNSLLGPKETFKSEELRDYAARAMQAKSLDSNPYPATEETLLEVLRESLM